MYEHVMVFSRVFCSVDIIIHCYWLLYVIVNIYNIVVTIRSFWDFRSASFTFK